jgi:thiamine transport system ATP-binding protein
MKPLLQVDQVRFAHPGARAMTFDFALGPGARLAVMGPSGSGKSTLLHLIAGFERPLAGAINIAGADMAGVAPSRRPVSMLFQDFNLFGHLDIARNVALGIETRLNPAPATRDRVDAALAAVGLDGFQKRLPGELSGGERQRAALARIVLRDKPLLLLDEPFAALGPSMRRDMINLLQDLPMAAATAMIMVTHSPQDARAFAGEVLPVFDGTGTALLPVDCLDAPEPGSALAAYLGTASSQRDT